MSDIHIPEHQWRKQQRKKRFKNKERGKKRDKSKYGRESGYKNNINGIVKQKIDNIEE